MAEEVLVKDALSSEMISIGAELARYLHTSQLATDALLWLYVPEVNTWRFVIASPEVKTRGPKKVYQDVRLIISKMPENQRRISFDDIIVVDSNEPLISLLRTVMSTGQSVVGIRFSQNVIDGVLVEDAYIYKLT
jgi:hypothetical protein